MSFPCVVCCLPVHEKSVICPHCAHPSGAPTDPIAVAEISVMVALDPKPEPPPLPYLLANKALAPVYEEAPEPESEDNPEPAPSSVELPRAIARLRTRDD